MTLNLIGRDEQGSTEFKTTHFTASPWSLVPRMDWSPPWAWLTWLLLTSGLNHTWCRSLTLPLNSVLHIFSLHISQHVDLHLECPWEIWIPLALFLCSISLSSSTMITIVTGDQLLVLLLSNLLSLRNHSIELPRNLISASQRVNAYYMKLQLLLIF